MKYNSRGQLSQSWKVPHDAPSTTEQPFAVAIGPDGSVFVAYATTARVEKYSPQGTWVTSWKDATDSRAGDATRHLTGFAVAGQSVFTAASAPPRIHVWTLDGQSKLENDLGGQLDGVTSPQIAVTSRGEFLVFDPNMPRVLRFRLHL